MVHGVKSGTKVEKYHDGYTMPIKGTKNVILNSDKRLFETVKGIVCRLLLVLEAVYIDVL